MKFHLLTSTEPLKEGAAHKALCGELVRDSKFAAMIDEATAGQQNVTRVIGNWRGVCRTCVKQPVSGNGYIYAARESTHGLEANDEDFAFATKD